MLIQTQDLPLIEAIFEFLRSNAFINDGADLSRRMGKSRSYLSTIRYNGHDPSPESYRNLSMFLHECKKGCSDESLNRWLEYYTIQIDEVLS